MADEFKVGDRYVPAGAVEPGRAPTRDELVDLLWELMTWHCEQVTSGGGLPTDLYLKVHYLLRGVLARQPMSRQQIQRLRWSYVCEGLDRLENPWDGSAYEYAAERLSGSPAGSGPAAMKTDYNEMQKKLSAELRRPRTYRRR